MRCARACLYSITTLSASTPGTATHVFELYIDIEEKTTSSMQTYFIVGDALYTYKDEKKGEKYELVGKDTEGVLACCEILVIITDSSFPEYIQKYSLVEKHVENKRGMPLHKRTFSILPNSTHILIDLKFRIFRASRRRK